MFDIQDAEIVQEVFNCRGFRAAAHKLRLSQSVVSARIADVESRLGITIFVRERRGARLTPQGRLFLDQASRLKGLRDQIAANLYSVQGFAGTLRIGVSETIVHTWLPIMLKKIRIALPNAQLELSVDTSPVLAQQLLDDHIDIAILMRQSLPTGMVVIPIYTCKLDWFAAAGCPVLARPLALNDLAQSPIITFPKDTVPFREVKRLFANPDLPVPLIHGCASLATILHLVRDGFGIGLLPVPMAGNDVKAGLLRPLKTTSEVQISDLEFALCYGSMQEHSTMKQVREAALSAVEAYHPQASHSQDAGPLGEG
ncbi:LysR family transcriptional regulator [Microvirga sp. P5_D2]